MPEGRFGTRHLPVTHERATGLSALSLVGSAPSFVGMAGCLAARSILNGDDGAAVDTDIAAVDERGVLRHQHGDHMGDFLRFAAAFGDDAGALDKTAFNA